MTMELTQLAICLRQSGTFLPYCFSFSLAERKKKQKNGSTLLPQAKKSLSLHMRLY
jgi:hypothetical protein